MSEEKPGILKSEVEYFVGAMKESLGKALGHEKMQTEGAAEKLSGQQHIEQAKAAMSREGTKERVGGAAEEARGAMTESQEDTVKGKAQQAKGAVKQELAK